MQKYIKANYIMKKLVFFWLDLKKGSTIDALKNNAQKY